MSIPIEEELLAALKVARGCLDGHTSLEAWDLIDGAIRRAEAEGLGPSTYIHSGRVQQMLADAVAECECPLRC